MSEVALYGTCKIVKAGLWPWFQAKALHTFQIVPSSLGSGNEFLGSAKSLTNPPRTLSTVRFRARKEQLERVSRTFT